MYRRISCLGLLSFAILALAGLAQPPAIQSRLVGHDDALYGIAWRADGQLIATAAGDKAIRLFDLATGKIVRVYAGATGHTSLALSVAFHPEGHFILSSGADNSAKLWDVPTNSAVRTFAHAGGSAAIAVSPDNARVSSLGKDGKLRAFAVADGKALYEVPAHNGPGSAVAYPANGGQVLTTGADGTLRAFNPPNGMSVASLLAHSSPVVGLAVTPNSLSAVTAGQDGTVKVWQLPLVAPKVLATHGEAVNALFTSPDGNTIYSGSTDKAIRTTNVNGQAGRTFAGATAAIRTLAQSGPWLAAGLSDGRLAVWQVSDGKLLSQSPAHLGGVTSLAVNGNGVLSAGEDGLIRQWNLPTVPSRAIALPAAITCGATSADGQRVIAGGTDQTIRVWKVGDAQPERQLAGMTAAPTTIAVHSPTDLVIAGDAVGGLRMWNLSTGKEIGTITAHTGAVSYLAVLANGKQALSAGADGIARLWQMPVVAPKTLAHPGAVTTLAISNDGQRVLSVCNDKQLRLWNLGSGQAERTYPSGPQLPTATALSADGLSCAMADSAKVITIFRDGKEFKKLAPQPAEIRGLAFSPDGKTLAAGLANNLTRLIDWNADKETRSLPGPASQLVFAPKGDVLYAAADKVIRWWNLADGKELRQVQMPQAVTALSLSGDGSRLAATAGSQLGIWQTADAKPVLTQSLPAPALGVSLSANGQRVAVAGQDQFVRYFTDTGVLLESFAHTGPVAAVIVHPDGKRLISSSLDRSVRIWTPAVVAAAPLGSTVRSAVLTPAANALAIAADDGVRWLEWPSGKLVRTLPAGKSIRLALNGDGSRLASVTTDGQVTVWQVSDGKSLLSQKLAGTPTGLVMSPDGRKLAIGVTEGNAVRVRILDTATGRELQMLDEVAGTTRFLQFAADNRLLYLAGDDKHVRVVDTAVTTVWPGHEGGVVGLVPLANGQQILTAGKDKVIRLTQLSDGKALRTFTPMSETPVALAVSRDSGKLAVTAGQVTRIWTIADGKLLGEYSHSANVLSVTFSADNSRVLTGAADGVARVWNLANGQMMQGVTPGGAVQAVAFHPNNTQVITGSTEKSVTLTNLPLQRIIAASAKPLRAISLANGGTHVIPVGDEGAARVYNLANGNAERTIEGPPAPMSCVTAPKTGPLAAIGTGKDARLVSAADGRLLGTITAPSTLRSLAFHPTLPILLGSTVDKTVFAWNVAMQPGQLLPTEFGSIIQDFNVGAMAESVIFTEGTNFLTALPSGVSQWRLAGDAPVRNFTHPLIVSAAGWSPDGKFFATGCHDGKLRLWEPLKPQPIREINAHPDAMNPQNGAIYAVAWSPDSKQVASASRDGSLKVFDAASGSLVKECKAFKIKDFEKGHREAVYAVAFAPDGKFLYSGDADGHIKRWNLADGSVVAEFVNPALEKPKPADPKDAVIPPTPAHPYRITALRVRPDGKLVSVGPAAKLRGYLAVWTPEGKPIFAGELPTGPLTSLAISPDGSRLALASGPRERGQFAGEAVVLPMPAK